MSTAADSGIHVTVDWHHIAATEEFCDILFASACVVDQHIGLTTNRTAGVTTSKEAIDGTAMDIEVNITCDISCLSLTITTTEDIVKSTTIEVGFHIWS